MFARNVSRLIVIFTIICLGIVSSTSLVHAQYFGRNKVQYDKFDFNILKTQNFDVYFYPEMEESAQLAARMAERWYARLSRVFDHKLKGRQPLILYASSSHFQQTTTISGIIGEGTGGVTESFKRRIILPVGGSLMATDRVIGHELVHAFQYDITSQSRSSYAGASPGIARLPLWFVEGLAEYLSIGSIDPNTAMWMRDVTQRKKLPTIKKLDDPYKYFPYRYGQSVWAYITGKHGDEAVAALLKQASRVGELEAVLKRVLNMDFETLTKEWHQAMNETYNPIAEKTRLIERNSRPLFMATEEKRVNVSPALSPDGSQVVFLSSRDLFSIDMYLADAKTGKIIRRLIKTATNPHFESLQFLNSSGSWDSKGERFVFGGITKSEPVLVVVNTKTGNREKEVVFKQLGEILNPTWSPDGRFVAFSALDGGLSDIFLFDLETDELKKLTDDPFSDLYPAWSPDGRTIAFVTDRFSSDLSILSIGDFQLALLNPDTGDIQRIRGFLGAKNINPQWAPDSKSLFFMSDRNGISNVYRVDLASEEISQVTNLYTGVSGIMAESPALSISQETGHMAFSVYTENNYSIYAIDSFELLSGEKPNGDFGEISPSLLPPRKTGEGEVIALLNNPLYGLPEEADFEISNYKPKLALDYISPSQMAVGTDRFGMYAGGGITLNFSDMLGYHNLFTMAQVSNRVEDSALLAGYQNMRSRLNWGAVVQRIPYVYGGYSVGYDDYFGQTALLEQELIFRQVNYQASIFAFYPFNQSRRFELSAGYRFIDYQQEVHTRVYTIDGFFIDRYKQELDAPESMYFGYFTAAYVYDSSFFGATAPILGQSYRLEYTPYFGGNLNFSSILADYRRYFMPVRPFTLAFRIMHYGRYGKNASDNRFYPLFLGYETLLRGYNSSSFDVNEIDVYAQLFGSKLAIANFELRFPLFGILGLGRGYYGILPLDFVAFYDVGIAWGLEADDDSENKPFFLGGNRKPLTSAGIGVRMNLMGYLILGFNAVKPFNRPNKNWVFQFTIMPGF
ncbi:MAG: PD40 domain-containing protein [Candidatus Aminicenantes bacterium]|nr:MAG: PD40 domain-containing protein [Candidatus Aminicenantes bacterium]